MEVRPRALPGFAALVAVAALGLAGPGLAHVFPLPTYVASEGTTPVELTVPNERRVPLTGFELRVPAGLEVAGAGELEGWTSAATGRRASWTGGNLAPFASATFPVELEVGAPPGTVVLDAVERFEDGRHVRWPVSLVVVPADEPGQRLGVAVVVGVLGLLALTIGGALLWRRSTRQLREH
jgi:hypothetical protein